MSHFKKIALFLLILLVTKIYPSDAVTFYSKGWYLVKKKQYQQAFQSFLHAIRVDNRHVPSYLSASWLLLDKLGKPSEALVYISRAENITPDEPEAAQYYAMAYEKLQNYSKSLFYYLRSLELFKKARKNPSGWIYSAIGQLYLYKVPPLNFNKAIEYFTLALQTELDAGAKKNTHAMLADAYYKNNDLINALGNAKIVGRDFWITKFLSPRTVVLHCVFNMKVVMKKSFSHIRPGMLKIHLPMNTYYQTFVSAVSTPGYTRIIKEGRENLALFDFRKGFPEKLVLKMTVKNSIVNASPVNVMPFSGDNTEINVFASFGRPAGAYFKIEYDIENVVLKNLVLQITQNDRTTHEKLISLYKWVSKNIIHDMHIPRYANHPVHFRKISEVLQARHGFCTQISSLFIGMCKMIGVPARMISGLQAQPDLNIKQGVLLAHDTVEIYNAEKKQWVYLEPQGYTGFGINFWGHFVFKADSVSLQNDVIDIMVLWGVMNREMNLKHQLTYEIFQ